MPCIRGHVAWVPPGPRSQLLSLLLLWQDGLIMLAMKHMEGGCLRDVLRHPDARDTLGWHNWCVLGVRVWVHGCWPSRCSADAAASQVCSCVPGC